MLLYDNRLKVRTIGGATQFDSHKNLSNVSIFKTLKINVNVTRKTFIRKL